MTRSDRAQSTVIGVLLLTAVVVITVGSIGVFYLGTVSDQADASAPRAEMDVDLTNGTVSVTHVLGESLDVDDLVVILREGSSDRRYQFDATNVTGDGDADDRFEPTETFERGHALGTGAFEVVVIDREANAVVHRELLDVTAETDDGSDPFASFTNGTAPIAGNPIPFDASASGDPDGSIASYEWAFGDGTTGSGAVVSHTYTTGGTYTVSLTVTDDDGRTATVNETIRVSEPLLLEWQTAADWDGAATADGVAHQPFGQRNSDAIQLGYPASSDGLVGYWPLDETGGSTVTDVTGAANDGTVHGSPSLSRSGIFGTTGIGLDGEDDHVTVGDDPALERSADDAVSVAAWVYKSSAQSGWIAVAQKSDQSYNLQLAGGDEPTLTIYDGDWNEARSGVSLETGTWHHLAGTYDGDTARIYVDGELQGSTGNVGRMGDAAGSDVGIGENLDANGRHLDGRVDELRIYDDAIAASAVERLANATGGTYVSESKTVVGSMEADDLRLEDVEATVDSGTASIRVESDPDGDGQWEERSDPIELSDDRTAYDVTGLSSASSTFRLRVSIRSPTVSATPILSNVTITGGDDSRGSFAVSSLDAPGNVTPGGTYSVDAVVENEGSTSRTETVRYQLGDAEVDSRTVQLAAGETRSVEFQYTIPEGYARGAVSHGVYGSSDSATGTVAVLVSPTIDQFDVSDESVCIMEFWICWNGDAAFSVSWSASDANGDLETVSVRLVDSEGTVVDEEQTDVTGGDDSGVTTLADDGGYHAEYTIEIEVADRTGRTASDFVVDAADETGP